MGTAVDLFWIPLGAGGHVVRFNGLVYEAITAAWQRRPRRAIYHAALVIELDGSAFTVEMTPVPDADGARRGVVAEGPVGARVLGRLRVFRYEIRRTPDGVIPDLAEAVASPVRVTDDEGEVRRLFDALPRVPTLVWGRDELRVGDMWSCNSIVSWAMAAAGLDPDDVALPPGGRAPGWQAGIRCAAMPSWSDIERAEPDFAARVQRLFDAGRHKTIATLRADGSPRISGIECEFEGGDVRFGSMSGARKGADLRRDPRFALHSPTSHPGEGKENEWAGEAKIAGRAVPDGPVTSDDPDAAAPDGESFVADIDEVVITRLNDEATKLVVEWWTPAAGLRSIERD